MAQVGKQRPPPQGVVRDRHGKNYQGVVKITNYYTLSHTQLYSLTYTTILSHIHYYTP
jgi:hypothetical protein